MQIHTGTNMQKENTYCQRFNIADIEKGTNTLICGRKLTGKSTVLVTLIQNRLYDHQNVADSTDSVDSTDSIDSVNSEQPLNINIANKKVKVVIFASCYVSSSYKKYFPENNIYEKYDSSVMKKLIESQQKEQGETELIIGIDDVAVNKDFWKDKYIRDVVRYGSSLGITTIFSIQYAGQLDDVFRRNIDYVFIFHDHNLENQKLLFQEFGGIFENFHDFKIMLDECIAEPYRCLVFDLKNPHKEARHAVFWYKSAQLQRRFIAKPKKSWISQLCDKIF
jgi:hypothetical protein